MLKKGVKKGILSPDCPPKMKWLKNGQKCHKMPKKHHFTVLFGQKRGKMQEIKCY